MSPDGLRTCPHCRAILQASTCAICGRSAHEAPAPRVPVTRARWWTTFPRHELRTLGIVVSVALVVAAALAFVLTRSPAEPVAAELPPPAPGTSAPPDLTPQGQAPSIAEAIRSNAVVVPGAPREVGTGLAPWETAPPVDFVTGVVLDPGLDFTADIARVDALVAAVPEPWVLRPLDPPELLTFAGRVDVATVEATQPFAARMLHDADGTELGEVWLVASSGTADGDAYLAAARARWNTDAAVDQYSPEVGIRLWRLGGDPAIDLWAADLDTDALVVIQAPVDLDPRRLTDLLGDWRRSVAPR